MLATPEAFVKLKAYFGEDRLRDIFIEIPDGERLPGPSTGRCMKNRTMPRSAAGFLADREDFSEEKIRGSRHKPSITSMRIWKAAFQDHRDMEHDRI